MVATVRNLPPFTPLPKRDFPTLRGSRGPRPTPAPPGTQTLVRPATRRFATIAPKATGCRPECSPTLLRPPTSPRTGRVRLAADLPLRVSSTHRRRSPVYGWSVAFICHLFGVIKCLLRPTGKPSSLNSLYTSALNQ